MHFYSKIIFYAPEFPLANMTIKAVQFYEELSWCPQDGTSENLTENIVWGQIIRDIPCQKESIWIVDGF